MSPSAWEAPAVQLGSHQMTRAKALQTRFGICSWAVVAPQDPSATLFWTGELHAVMVTSVLTGITASTLILRVARPLGMPHSSTVSALMLAVRVRREYQNVIQLLVA